MLSSDSSRMTYDTYDNLSAPFEDILIPLLLQHSLILLVLTLSIVVLVVALLGPL